MIMMLLNPSLCNLHRQWKISSNNSVLIYHSSLVMLLSLFWGNGTFHLITYHGHIRSYPLDPSRSNLWGNMENTERSQHTWQIANQLLFVLLTNDEQGYFVSITKNHKPVHLDKCSPLFVLLIVLIDPVVTLLSLHFNMCGKSHSDVDNSNLPEVCTAKQVQHTKGMLLFCYLALLNIPTVIFMKRRMKVVINLIKQFRISQYNHELANICSIWPIGNMTGLLATEFTNKGQMVLLEKYKEEVKVIIQAKSNTVTVAKCRKDSWQNFFLKKTTTAKNWQLCKCVNQ